MPDRGRPRRVLTREQLEIWREFIETADALRSQLSSRLQLESDLSPADYAVLLALHDAGSRRVRSSELAEHVGWERSRLSHHLGRMERRGLIGRENCTADNRGAEVVLSTAGAEMFRAASVPHLQAIRELFVDALTPEQLRAAGDIAEALSKRLGRRRRS